jgi:hypothetical protein
MRLLGFLMFVSLVCSVPQDAHAACSDRPSPRVDWSGCMKINRIMTGYDFQSATLNRVNFSGSDLASTGSLGDRIPQLLCGLPWT